jgi:hypothetical protein
VHLTPRSIAYEKWNVLVNESLVSTTELSKTVPTTIAGIRAALSYWAALPTRIGPPATYMPQGDFPDGRDV